MKTKLIVAGVLFITGCVLEGVASLVLSSAELAVVIAKAAKIAVKA